MPLQKVRRRNRNQRFERLEELPRGSAFSHSRTCR
jgi:hypothetical protein